MRWPRFTLLQLFLVMALIGLLAGWLQQAWETRSQGQLMSVEISPDGKFVAAMYWSRGPKVWDISGVRPQQIAANQLTKEHLPEYPFTPFLRFVDDGSVVFHRYTPRGSEVKVTSAVNPNKNVWVTVQDTGRGIRAEVLPHIFERFYKEQDSRGTGLGLAIASSLVDAHGGSISAESIPDHGTTIRIELPHE